MLWVVYTHTHYHHHHHHHQNGGGQGGGGNLRYSKLKRCRRKVKVHLYFQKMKRIHVCTENWGKLLKKLVMVITLWIVQMGDRDGWKGNFLFPLLFEFFFTIWILSPCTCITIFFPNEFSQRSSQLKHTQQ